MSKPTILKDELGILKADKSAVLIELRSLGEELKEAQKKIRDAEKNLADVKNQIEEETARRDDMYSRVVFLSEQESELKQELNSTTIKAEAARNKYAQEVKQHLGRIKELEERKRVLDNSFSTLKEVYDKNANAVNDNLSDLNKELRKTKSEFSTKSKELKDVQESLETFKKEEGKLTKERLKREDKIRAREKNLEMLERGIKKREEDLQTMAGDLTVIYYRLKELYAKVDPKIDIDRLITKAI